MKKNLSSLALGLLSILMMNHFAYSQASVVYLASGATAPTDVKSSTNAARVASATPSACDALDIRIFPSALPQSEIHLSINKQNPQVLLLSANTFPVTNSSQGAYWSTTGGQSWVGADVLPNGVSGRGDPSTAFDATGTGYIASMSRPSTSTNINDVPNGYSLLRTTDNGANWTTFNRVADNISGFDKEMIAADDTPGSPFANNIYSAWSVNPGGINPSVGFHRSTNGGASFSAPITLSAAWGQGTNVQTGPNGEVYVCWADYNNSSTDWSSKGLGFCRSTDGGVSFPIAQRVFVYTGIRAFNPATNDDENPAFNMIRVNDFPSMAVDKGNGSQRGRIYVVYAAKENGNGKAVIQIRSSNNSGTTWTGAQTISITNGRQNWFPWIAVDNVTGNVYVVYYSLDETTGFNTNTYVAISTDGGASFNNQKVSDVNHVTARIN